MSKKTKKFLDFDVRAVEGEDRTYWFTASTPSRDRMGDIIVQEGWRTEDFLKTGGPILWGHDYYSLPIGRGKQVSVSQKSLDIKVEFQPSDINPFAGQVERLVKGGWIRTGSVGFQVYKVEDLTEEEKKQRPDMKWGKRLFGDLLEFSIVPVPANPEALAQRDFSDALARGFGMKQDEAVSKFLPYKDEKGTVSPRLLRASLAAAWGARGGVKITDAEKSSCINHLLRVANDNQIEVPTFARFGDGSDPALHVKELREEFKDVWHDELLDLIHKADSEDQEVLYKLIRGEKRNQLTAARDALNVILGLAEEQDGPKPAETEPPVDIETAGMMKELITNLSSLNARLK